MKSVDTEPLWSILDEKGTQTMMRQVLGEAGSVTDFETVRKRLAVLLVRHGLSARREVQPHYLDRRFLCRCHHLIVADCGCDAAQDERVGCGKASVERYIHRLDSVGCPFTSPLPTRISAACCTLRSFKDGALKRRTHLSQAVRTNKYFKGVYCVSRPPASPTHGR